MAIPLDEYRERRRRAMDLIGGDAALIVPAGSPVRYASDIEHRFRADADFLYLAGFSEPESILVLRPGAAEPCTLFVRPRDPERETWAGARPGPEGALELAGADAAYPLSELDARLPDLLHGTNRLFHSPWQNAALDTSVRAALAALRSREATGRHAPDTIVQPGAVLHELRLVKSAAEMAAIGRAAEVTALGLSAGIACVAPGATEYQVEAAVDGAFRAQGAAGPGFATIVAAGANACCLHYTDNRATIGADEMVLIDCGAEVDDYNADMTRTVPASGRFTPAQRDLYEAVREVQEQLIGLVRPGTSIADLRAQSAMRLTDALVRLGILHGSVDEILASGAHRRYTIHGPSHWLGLDVHDVGTQHVGGVPRPFTPGMVLTVEPGLYVGRDDEDALAAFRGQGVRIEDDVAVTEDGGRVLTRQIPVDADAVAALVGGGAR